MGTLNNLGTVLLTIADLSTIETEIEVDETEVTHMKLGDRAKVTLDAFPDTSFAGEVTEIGNSPIVSGASSAQQGVDFKVVITILDTIPNVRPGLSADAEITVASAKGVPAIPIQSLTARRKRDLKGYKAAADTTAADTTNSEAGETDVEDKVVSGNFKAIRELKDGQRVKITGKIEKGAKEKEKAK
jgi:hypothetical protein